MKYSQALAAALSAVLCGSFASASPKDIAGLAGVAEQAEHLIENCFRDEKGVIRSAIGRDLKPLGASGKLDDPGVSGDFLRFDGCPLREDFISYENSGMVMGAYLVAMTEKFRKTGEASARDRARRTFQGIRTVYRASQSVARGFFCKPWGGRPSRETSSDQYVYVMNGLDRYCAIADETERREIALMIGDMARFWIDRGYRYLYYGSPIDWQKSRFLSFCALAYRQTGDAFFRREFERLLALPEVRNTIPFGIGCYPVDALRDSRGRQVYEMCPEQFSSAWLSLKAVRELAADDAYVTGTMPRIFAAVRPAISKEGFCHRYMVKDLSGAFVALEETLPDCGARPPWNWKFLSLRRPFHIGGMQSAMFLAAAIDMAPHDPVVGQWVGEHGLPLLSRIANGHFTWYEDPLGVLPAEDKWMTRVLNGDAVAHWLQAYWTLSPEAVSVRQAVTNGVEVRWFETWMPAEDGARLYTYGTAPKEGVRCPIVVQRNPYVPESRVDGAAWALSRTAALRRGYAYVVQHVRGAGMSEGKRVPYEHEREDGLALLDFVRHLPWYNGEIFLAGGSYLASVHWAYLDANPPDVKGASLQVQDANRYGICYRNGFFKAGLHGDWFLSEYWKTDHGLPRNRQVRFSDFPLIDFSTQYWGRPEPALDNVFAHPRPDDPFWTSGQAGSGASYRQALLKSTMPVLLKTGFYDIYTEGVCDMWRELSADRRANCALLIDAYDHGGSLGRELKGTLGEFPGGSRADEAVGDLDWFDSIRSGAPCPRAPKGRMRYYALWENAWHEEPELRDGSRRVVCRLGTGVRGYVYDPERPLPVFPGSGGINFGGMRLQPEPDFRDDVLSYLLSPVTERLDVRGRMTAELTVASDCEDTCFYARVSVRKRDGKWYLLRDDITSILFQSADYRPWEKTKVRFRFADHAFRLEPGDVLRMDVASACSQFAPHANVKGPQFKIRHPKVAKNQVFGDGSELILPVCDPK